MDKIFIESKELTHCHIVLYVDNEPLNYCTIQINYRAAQRKSGVPYTGTHILRHGMSKFARKLGGGLDAVLAITGHKGLKLVKKMTCISWKLSYKFIKKFISLFF